MILPPTIDAVPLTLDGSGMVPPPMLPVPMAVVPMPRPDVPGTVVLPYAAAGSIVAPGMPDVVPVMPMVVAVVGIVPVFMPLVPMPVGMPPPGWFEYVGFVCGLRSMLFDA